MSSPQNDEILKCDKEQNLKVGKVVDCAFRYAIENGRFSPDTISFFQTKEAGEKFKTDGCMPFLVKSSNAPSSIRRWGHLLYYSTPVKYEGDDYYICSQLRTHSLRSVLEALAEIGITTKDIVELCSKADKKTKDSFTPTFNSTAQIERFQDYLQQTMPKSSANSYFSALKKFDRIILEKKISHVSLFVADKKVISLIHQYVSSDMEFKRINNEAHSRYSSAFRKYEAFLEMHV